MTIYRDYYSLPFTRIYWSRLLPIYVDRECGEYRCECCRKLPHECDNEESAKEYQKILMLAETAHEKGAPTDRGDYVNITPFGNCYPVPLYETGGIRVDQHGRTIAQVVWKVQRELAKSAGFKLMRTNVW